MPESLQTNTTISHYCIVSKIGEGGMGEVYVQIDQEDNDIMLVENFQ